MTRKREVHIEEVLTHLTDQISPSVGILASLEDNYGVEVVTFHGLEKPQSVIWSSELWHT